jgi:hypothetical protein
MQVCTGYLDDSTPVCFTVTGILSTMLQKCRALMTEGRELPVYFAVWHVCLLSSNYGCNNATCF